jgi:hypothetical protein
MKSHLPTASLLLLLIASFAVADDQVPTKAPDASAPRMSKDTRMNLVRAFNAELVYIRTPFPMGNKGLHLENGVITPNGDTLAALMATYGPAAKPGDLARISNIIIKDRSIHFEINGGPVKKKKWYQRIEVGGMGGTTPVAPSDANANPRGSFVDLEFEKYVPELSPQQLKDLLRPVFDFNSKSALEAYLDTVPPKVKDAIKNHQVLVGMNREMVTYSKGRPPKKDRERDGEVEYEEWIYGDPPKDVDFVRFVGDEVVRVETMKVTGEKMVRTEKEVDIAPGPAVATKAEQEAKPVNAPTLRRPGEELPDASSQKGADRPSSNPPAAPQPSPGQDPGVPN